MRITLTLSVATLLTSACSTFSGQPSATPTLTSPPTTTVPMAVQVSPAPKQGRLVANPVKWDPCFQVPDSIIQQLGFDPETRERSDWIDATYTFLGCKFSRRSVTLGMDTLDGILTIQSANITIDQVKAKETAEYPVEIGTRTAVRWDDHEFCTLAMNGPDGVVYVSAGGAPTLSNWVACDHLEEQSKTVDSVLPK